MMVTPKKMVHVDLEHCGADRHLGCCGDWLSRRIRCASSPQDGFGTMDRWRPGLWAGAGMAVDGRRNLHHLYLSWRQRLGIFKRRSRVVHPGIPAFDVHHFVLHSPAALGIGAKAQT